MYKSYKRIEKKRRKKKLGEKYRKKGILFFLILRIKRLKNIEIDEMK